MNAKETKQIAHKIIMSFPKAKNGQPYLTLKNGRKLFFNRFIKKYGIDNNNCQYNSTDIKRRLTKVEFFDFFVKEFDLKAARTKRKLILESHFHIMVIGISETNKANRYELISFYPK